MLRTNLYLKNIFQFIVVLVFFAMSCIFPVFADVVSSSNDLPKFIVSSGEVIVGNKIVIDVSLDKPNNIVAMQFTLQYDPSVFEIQEDEIVIGKEILGLGAKNQSVDSKNGKVSLIIAGAFPLSIQGTLSLASIPLKVKLDAKSGEYALALTDVVLATGIPATTVAHQTSDGTIKVLSTKGSIDTNSSGGKTPSGTGLSVGNSQSINLPFIDIPDDIAVWAIDSLKGLYAIGAINGKTETEFDPEGKVTRAEFAKMLVKAIPLQPHDEIYFSDVAKDSWYYEFVAVAAGAGVIKGTGNDLFEPDSFLTREQMCTMIYRALDANGAELSGVGQSTWADSADISDWAKESIGALFSNGIINGVGENYFDPQGYAERAATVKVIFGACSRSSAK